MMVQYLIGRMYLSLCCIVPYLLIVAGPAEEMLKGLFRLISPSFDQATFENLLKEWRQASATQKPPDERLNDIGTV